MDDGVRVRRIRHRLPSLRIRLTVFTPLATSIFCALGFVPSTHSGRGGRRDWPEYCLFILACLDASQACNSCPWSDRITPFARPGQGLFCIPLSSLPPHCLERAVVLHQSHTSYPLCARAGRCRSFDKMPSRTSLARQGSLCCRVRQQGDWFGTSPRCGRLASLPSEPPEDSIMSDVLPSIITLSITALLVFRRELTTPRAKKGAPRAAAASPSKARGASR
jgi:hypothetical protein